MLNVSIIGFGRTGSHLYYALKKAKGINTHIAQKSSKAKPDLKIISKSDLIFICTDDKNIKSVSKKLASVKIDLNSKIIFHTSGAKSSDELASLKLKGISAGSFHPVQTFREKTNKYAASFKNIHI